MAIIFAGYHFVALKWTGNGRGDDAGGAGGCRGGAGGWSVSDAACRIGAPTGMPLD